jgi:hypothetical protein
MSAVVSPSISNALGIITDAAYSAGKLRMGSDPDSEFVAKWMRSLNKLINFYMTQGLKLWLIENILVTLVPPISPLIGVALYTFGPTGTVVMQKPLRVISGFYLYNNGNQQPLTPMSYPQEYQMLSEVLVPGFVNSYAVDKQQNTLNVFLWNPPDAFTAANGAVHLMMEVSVVNFSGVTDQMNFPIEWALLLEWGLAEQMATGQPIAVQARCAAMSKKYQDAAEDWDVEDADTMFQPDQRQTQYRGRFR